MASKEPASDNFGIGAVKKLTKLRSGSVDMRERFEQFAARMEARAANATTPDRAQEFAIRAKLFRLLADGRNTKGDALHHYFGRFNQRHHTQ
jgi:hypothetical protein